MTVVAFETMPACVKNVLDAAQIDLLDDEECLDAIFEASFAVEPGQRAEAMEWAAAYLDMLRSRALGAGAKAARRRSAKPAATGFRFRPCETAPC
ncbi:hypothetical protein [Azospirillum sp. ST 5-10]|uniref:hypothetical protein n=1 Tax=unclassified Azospirillum TaxID=2630922 RepID=UPI003F4A0964